MHFSTGSRLAPLSALLGGACALAAPLHAPHAALVYAPGKVVVRWAASLPVPAASDRPETGIAGLDRALSDAGVRAIRPLVGPAVRAARDPERRAALERYARLVIDPHRDPVAAARSLAGNPWIESAEPVPRCPVARIPSDSLFPQQWMLHTAAGHDAHLAAAWDVTTGDSTVLVAVLDTGVDWRHPDLGGPPPYLSGAISTDWREVAGEPGVDDDSTGYADDVRGWDFVDLPDSASAWPGEDWGGEDNDPFDFNGHGTEVAGVAAAITDNESGVAGVGWRCRILPVRIGFSAETPSLSEGGFVDMDFAAAGLVYAADRGAVAATASWGSAQTDFLDAAVDYALAAGMAIVNAAGNAGGETQDGNYLSTRGDCLDVAATDSSDVKATFSSYGPWVDIAAPGVNIWTTGYSHTTETDEYLKDSGTSFAVPCVAGVLALLRAARPDLSLAEARERLLARADPIDGLNAASLAGKLGWGRVNAAEAVAPGGSRWETFTGGSPRGALAIADLGGNARGVVAAVDDDGHLTVLGVNGVPLPGWPIAVGSIPGPPSIGVLDGGAAIVAGGADSVLRAFWVDGIAVPGWPRRLDGAVRSGAAIGVVRAGDRNEVVVGTDAHTVWALDEAGNALPGWPRPTGGVVRGTPALLDLDADSVADVVVGAADSLVYAWGGSGAPLAGWPVRVSGMVTVAAAGGDLFGTGETDVVVASADGRAWAFSARGDTLPGWPVTLGAGSPAAPALADLDGDGTLDAIVVAGAALHVLRSDGTEMAGWPATLSGSALAAPLAADVDGDGSVDVVAATTKNDVHALTAHGVPLAGWPRWLGGAIRAAPVIGDAGGDGVPNMVAGGADGWIVSWALPGTVRPPESLPWATYAHDAARTGRFGAPISSAVRPGSGGGASQPEPALRALTLPARGGATFLLSNFDGGPLDVDLLDAAGRRVRRLALALPAGNQQIRWDGRDDRGRPLPSGLYFARATSVRVPHPLVARTLLLR